MRTAPLIGGIGACLAFAAAGCGGGDDQTPSTAPSPPAASSNRAGRVTGEGSSGAVRSATVDEQAAAAEASPESPASGPETSELSGADEEAVAQTVQLYVDALDRHAAARVCALLAPGALRLRELPERRGGCVGSLRASIGTTPSGGGPAWRRSAIAEIKAVSVEGGGARATATVTHRFSDRKYVSVEEDVIYLERRGERWLLEKPSGTFYRAVGYADPPLSALTPPH